MKNSLTSFRWSFNELAVAYPAYILPELATCIFDIAESGPMQVAANASDAYGDYNPSAIVPNMS